MKKFPIYLGVFLAISIIGLKFFGVGGVFEPPYLLPLTNLIFGAIVPLIATYIASRSYLKSGSATMLFFSAATFLFGIISLSAGFMINISSNAAVTMYDSGILVSSILFFMGAISTRNLLTIEKGREIMNITYIFLASIIFAGLLFFLIISEYLPTFFVQGIGPTFIDQLVLGSAILLFAVSSYLLWRIYRGNNSEIVYWYALGLALICIGMFAVFLQDSVGSVLGWTGRITKYIGVFYLLVSVLKSEAIKRGIKK